MLEPYQLHEYQQKAVNFQCSRLHSALWLDMGLGKTVITLSSIAHLIQSGYLRSVVIVAPIRVIRMVWRQEALKWSHTKDLTFSMVAGTKDQRTRALLRNADIYLINYENLKWLSQSLETYFIKKGKPLPFDGIVWDEISKMKNSATQRVKAVKKILPEFKWSTGLTGTPASNGYKDLHGQYLVLDRGERLGTSKTAFRNRFYRKVGPYKEVPYDDTESTIKRLIGDITLEMSAEDYNPLPDLIINDINIDLPKTIREKYESLEKDFFFHLDSGEGVEVFNQAALTNKCLQFANGSVYPISGMPLWESVHTLKLEALEDIIEEAAGKPVLCSYAYRSDAERIMEYFKELRPINLTDCKSESALNNAMSRWQSNDCQLMIGHPACVHQDTLVFTERNGWVKIIDVRLDDRVFDGIEFVNHNGCIYSGYKDVIDVFGITMTPDHKILINNEWVDAQHVDSSEEGKRTAQFRWENENTGDSEMQSLRWRTNNSSSKYDQTQQNEINSLSTVQVSSNDRNPNMENLEWIKTPSQRSIRQKLWCPRNRIVQGVGNIRELLSGYARRLFRQFDNRAHQYQRGLQQGQLPMGYQYGTAIQQAKQSVGNLPGRTNSLSRIMSKVWFQQNDVINETQPWNDSRSSGRRLQEFTLREKSERKKCKTQRKAHVYDLVNCGPRHRFLVRNNDGEMFIFKNSMGHGIDGLQKNGNILVWFGLNWSLDLYEQFNARIRRQGQGVPVICHRILIQDTLDQAQALALDEKAQTQTQLRSAIKEYRQSKSQHQ